MRIKRTIIAPLVMTIGSAGMLAGSIAPIVASSSAGAVVAASSSATPGMAYGG